MWHSLLSVFSLVALCLIAYSRVHSLSYFNVDDRWYVFGDSRVTGPLNWATVKWAFTHAFVLNYDPLTFLAHSIDVRLFQTTPGGHHVVNVVLHALNAALLFWVFRRATGRTGCSFMVAALFAMHPVNVENVAWISELKTLLSTVFFLLALGAYGWYVQHTSRTRMLLVALLYGMALLAKPQAITFPFVLLLWDYWPLRRFGWSAANGPQAANVRSFGQLVKEKSLLFVIMVGDAVITSLAEHKGNQPYTLVLRTGNAIICYVRYAGKAFWPVHLAYLYPHPGYSLRWFLVCLSLCVLIVVTALVLKFRHIGYLPVGWFWFLGTLFPMIGLIQIDVPAMADRYAYVSYIGLFMIVCWSVSEWADAHSVAKSLVTAASVAVIAVLGTLTWIQTGYWKDSVTMWTRSDEVSQNNWFAEQVLAELYEEQGRYDEALKYLQLATEKRPADWLYMRTAFLEERHGRSHDAIRHYKAAIALTKDDHLRAQAWANMGHVYGALGAIEQERICYRNAQTIRTVPPRWADR
jgi:protein O-mannosyl-transferase